MTAETLKRDAKILSAVEYLAKSGAISVGVFGSYARGQVGPDSDLDILVDFGPHDDKSLFDMIRMEQELSSSIGIRVDLLTREALNPHIRNQIMKEETRIYG